VRIREMIAPFNTDYSPPGFMLKLGQLEQVAASGASPVEFEPPSLNAHRMGRLRTVRAEIPDAKMRRIIQFIRTCYVKKTMEPLNCYSFLAYVAGWINDPRRQVRVPPREGYYKSVPENGLQAGGLYVVSRNGHTQHGMIGWSATHNLSVLGPGMPLVITRNDAQMRLYDGTHVLQLTG
jgi:hypothetical protein